MAKNIVIYNGNEYDLEHNTRGDTKFWIYEGRDRHILFEAEHTKNKGAVYKVTSVEWDGGITVNGDTLETKTVINLHKDVTIELT